jgi:hypothetical protein
MPLADPLEGTPMARAFAMVLILLLVMAYLSLFLAWNAKPQPVTTWELGAQYTQDLPIGLLFILGVLVGAIAMAIGLMGPWNALKHSEAQQRALVEKARAKLKALDAKVKKLTEASDESRAASTAEGPDLTAAEAAALAEVAAAEDPTPAGKAKGKPPAEDPEVI